MTKALPYRRNLGIVAVVIGTLCSSSCNDNVKTDYNHHVDFSQFQTYSWGNIKTENPFYVDRIRRAVNRDLQDKGWKLVESGGSTTVFANGEVHDEKQLETTYNSFGPGWGGGWGWGGWGWGGYGPGGFPASRTRTETIPVAKLVIDIFESNDKKLIWRGIVARTVSDEAQKNVKGLDKDIDKLLKNFPPKTNG